MDGKLQVITICASLGLLLTILELVRRRRLLERYALLWLFCAAALVALSVWSNLLESLADLVGVVTPANALFAIAFAFVALLLLHFSLAVSKLAEQSKVLAQRLAIAQHRIAELEGGGTSGASAEPSAELAEFPESKPAWTEAEVPRRRRRERISG
jgi:hypothetical protein